MDFTDITIAELMDIPDLQNLLDSYSRLTGIATAILDLKGAILAATGWQPICTEFHRKNKVTALRCLESDTILAGKLAKGERYKIYKCKNGLVDIAAPIKIGDVHVGNIFIGQFLLEPPDIEFFRQQAEKFDFNKESYLTSLAKVPVFSMDQINHAVDFLTNLTTVIGNAGLDKEKLFDLNQHLEQRIEERTAELTYSNERLRVLTDASFEGIWLSVSGIIIEANRNMATIFGFQREKELIGKKVAELIAPEKREDVESKMACGYDKAYETLGCRKTGDVFPMEVHGRTFLYQGRQVRGAAIRDLTEQRKAENEIQALRGILPICSFCKKIRNDKGYWEQVDIYFRDHSEIDFSHSICPECLKKHYPAQYRAKDIIL